MPLSRSITSSEGCVLPTRRQWDPHRQHPHILASFTHAAITALHLADKTIIAEASGANYANSELIRGYPK